MCNYTYLDVYCVTTLLQSNNNMKPKEGEVTSQPWQWPVNYQVSPTPLLIHLFCCSLKLLLAAHSQPCYCSSDSMHGSWPQLDNYVWRVIYLINQMECWECDTVVCGFTDTLDNWSHSGVREYIIIMMILVCVHRASGSLEVTTESIF